MPENLQPSDDPTTLTLENLRQMIDRARASYPYLYRRFYNTDYADVERRLAANYRSIGEVTMPEVRDLSAISLEELRAARDHLNAEYHQAWAEGSSLWYGSIPFPVTQRQVMGEISRRELAELVTGTVINMSSPALAGPDISVKRDGGKPRLSLVSPIAITNIARVLEFGSTKYGDNNWRKTGLNYQRLIDATLRHLSAYNCGEDCDEESGLSHISHALCNLMMLSEEIETHPELDDRYKFDRGMSSDDRFRVRMDAGRPSHDRDVFASTTDRRWAGVTVFEDGYPDAILGLTQSEVMGWFATSADYRRRDNSPTALAIKFGLGSVSDNRHGRQCRVCHNDWAHHRNGAACI